MSATSPMNSTIQAQAKSRQSSFTSGSTIVYQSISRLQGQMKFMTGSYIITSILIVGALAVVTHNLKSGQEQLEGQLQSQATRYLEHTAVKNSRQNLNREIFNQLDLSYQQQIKKFEQKLKSLEGGSSDKTLKQYMKVVNKRFAQLDTTHQAQVRDLEGQISFLKQQTTALTQDMQRMLDNFPAKFTVNFQAFNSRLSSLEKRIEAVNRQVDTRKSKSNRSYKSITSTSEDESTITPVMKTPKDESTITPVMKTPKDESTITPVMKTSD